MYELCSTISSSNDRRHQMTLDLGAVSSPRKCFYPAVNATSSDFDAGGSKGASPDLEAFLLYASAGDGLDGPDNTTSIGTPTHILFPKAVTAEQEAYARGFVDALEELHRRQGVPTAVPLQSVDTGWTQSSLSSSTCHWTACNNASYTQLSSDNSSVVGQSSSVSSPGSSVGVPPSEVMVSASCEVDRRVSRGALDDGVQLVPRLSCQLTPPSSPDVDAIELARIDRKRERNRLAAQKCRSRKLEQIAVLESRCSVLRAQNGALSQTAGQLADEVARLRQTLAEHSSNSRCVLNDSNTTVYTSTAPPAACLL